MVEPVRMMYPDDDELVTPAPGTSRAVIESGEMAPVATMEMSWENAAVALLVRTKSAPGALNANPALKTVYCNGAFGVAVLRFTGPTRLERIDPEAVTVTFPKVLCAYCRSEMASVAPAPEAA